MTEPLKLSECRMGSGPVDRSLESVGFKRLSLDRKAYILDPTRIMPR